MIELTPVTDFEGSFATYREAFGVDDDTPWVTWFRSFVVRSGEWTAIVDTGVGPPGEDRFLPERDGRLPEMLLAVNVQRENVDAVLFTHLHVDHVGWNMRGGEPFFRNARYVAHRADYEFFTTTRGDRPYVREQVVALYETGRLELVDRDTELLRHAPGHTPGHCIVELGSVVVLGDLAVHELQLADPGLAYVAEEDPAQAAEARRRIFRELEGRTVALSHLGVGRLEGDGEGFRWVASK
jgi:glyoxylase-like metal-dependent hydrolase (beta-lactamase superfamily II)